MTQHSSPPAAPIVVQRVQTGVRMERRMIKVLKALAEDLDLTLGDLLEGIVLHAFDGKPTFSPRTLARIGELRKFYGLDLDSRTSHRLTESCSFERLCCRVESRSRVIPRHSKSHGPRSLIRTNIEVHAPILIDPRWVPAQNAS